MSVPDWWDMMMGVCSETRRILKPTGSAVFILQPNSEHVGQMRGWLWEFMAWVCREWNMVQDVWWWNYAAMPTGVCIPKERGLLKPSLKALVWCGTEGCYRNQEAVLNQVSERTIQQISRRDVKRRFPSGQTGSYPRMAKAAVDRGGSIPSNVLPILNNNPRHQDAGAHGHGAGTPLKLADWWTRYICPPGGVVADWFMGSGTMGLAALQNGCSFVGIEKFPIPERDINPKNNPDYFSTAKERIEKAQAEHCQLELAEMVERTIDERV
jgi:hypothetical protein